MISARLLFFAYFALNCFVLHASVFIHIPIKISYEHNLAVISGDADPRSKIKLFINKQFVGNPFADATGSWSWTMSPLPAVGSYTLYAFSVSPKGIEFKDKQKLIIRKKTLSVVKQN